MKERLNCSIVLTIVILTNTSLNAQHQDLYLSSNFIPLPDSTTCRYLVESAVVNGYSVYNYFLPHPDWIELSTTIDEIITGISDSVIDLSKLCKFKNVDVAVSKKMSIVPHGYYSLFNSKKRLQTMLIFDNGFLDKIYYYNKRGNRLNEIVDISSLKKRGCVNFTYYTRNYKKGWDISIVTIDAQGEIHINER